MGRRDPLAIVVVRSSGYVKVPKIKRVTTFHSITRRYLHNDMQEGARRERVVRWGEAKICRCCQRVRDLAHSMLQGQSILEPPW